ncbi:flagellar filament capping protein FliD [Paenibacillus tarimensis]|uniref:flagellar filament capping protein FliD n=1 Tax=Paenibacillus tarimensis TaxID=416012 RepID=UPI001F2B174B|nr:flagellar filament capping protein FliD [Paenibacillus tarimensis]MCF2944122.1 flagellar filament capping protein FliD [Paenibacillus tarimensis]
MRLSGLASGMDIDSMVKELMQAQRSKIDNIVKQRTRIEWQRDDYRTMASKIVDFRNNKLANYNLSSAINAKTSTVSGDMNALTVNSTSGTAAGSLDVKVTQVASSELKLYTYSATDKTKTLEGLGFTIDSANANNVAVKINGATLSLSKDGTLADLAATINTNSSKVKASALYDEASGKFSLTATQTGTDKLIVEGFAGTLDTTNSVAGKNAQATINGISYNQASNIFSVNGFNFTVKAVSATSTTITATQDTNKIIETVKSFVNDYNSLISDINGELSETRSYSYNPLTSEEKKGMTEDEIKLWEGRARNGTLRNDDSLSTMISELRTAATSLVAGIKDAQGNSIQIGITTGSYTEKGRLVLDEDKLRKALESNPDEVINLFSAKSSDTSPASTTSGVFAKMMDSSMDALNSMQKKAGTSLTSTSLNASFLESSLLSDQIRSMKQRETREESRLVSLENRYYKMFAAMETAINKYNSQAGSLSSFFSG